MRREWVCGADWSVDNCTRAAGCWQGGACPFHLGPYLNQPVYAVQNVERYLLSTKGDPILIGSCLLWPYITENAPASAAGTSTGLNRASY